MVKPQKRKHIALHILSLIFENGLLYSIYLAMSTHNHKSQFTHSVWYIMLTKIRVWQNYTDHCSH